MEEHEFEQPNLKNMVSIPLSFFDKLLKCYYGDGPRNEEKYASRSPESPAVEVVETGSSLKDLQLDSGLPQGYKPKGVALRKIEALNATREDQVTEE
jgi:hypothetical protein